MRAAAARVAYAWAALAGVLGAAVGAALLTTAIRHSTISTAALGFIELPWVMVLWAAPCAVMGFCAGYVRAARGRAGRPAAARRLLATVVLFAVGVPSTAYVLTNLAMGWEVKRVAAMSGPDLERVVASRAFGTNPFVLAEIAKSPLADPALLHEIALRKDPHLHEKLWSIFDTMGSNTHGLAVMRLVARNPNVDVETLELLAQSDNGYVRADVALNPKTPEQVLRRISQRSESISDWALAQNSKTPSSILVRLSQSSDDYVRSFVAANPGAAPDVLVSLAKDSQFNVRRNVAMNPSAPQDALQTLRQDSDARVRASVPRSACAGPTVPRSIAGPDGGMLFYLECTKAP